MGVEFQPIINRVWLLMDATFSHILAHRASSVPLLTRGMSAIPPWLDGIECPDDCQLDDNDERPPPARDAQRTRPGPLPR